MPKLIVVSGPSGVGKTYLAEQLQRLYPDKVSSVRLVTTRRPRTKEAAVDRTFVSLEEFKAMEQNQEFILTDIFQGHWYGYPKRELQPITKHLVVNAWPALLPKLVKLPDVIFVGLTITTASLSLLTTRMSDRGNSAQVISARIPLIQKDIRDIEALAHLIQDHGMLFTVVDNQTVPEVIIPWAETTLGLKKRVHEHKT